MRIQKAFTIVELLTVLVIISLLISILLPSISAVRRHAKDTAQKAQFLTIETALDAFKQDYGDYPPSDCTNPASPTFYYCGSSKLVEALIGWDLRGFDPCSVWRSDGQNASNTAPLYDNTTLFDRKGPYLEVATANVFHIGITPTGKNDGLFDFSTRIFNITLYAQNYVFCDIFGVRKLTDPTGKTVLAGTPILYYKANTASKSFKYNNPTDTAQIYNYFDNRSLLNLGKLNANGRDIQKIFHPLSASDGLNFYASKFNYLPNAAPAPAQVGGSGIGYGLWDPKIQQPWPYRPDSYILISAGADGLYGTADDIHNF